MTMRGHLFALVLLGLSACAGGAVRHPVQQPISDRFTSLALPPMRQFTAAGGAPFLRSRR